MRKNFKPKPLFFPEPVCIVATYDSNGNPDAMNAAWGGISDTYEMHLCLSHTHKTVKNILENRCFTVSCGTETTYLSCDYVGMISANDIMDKMEKSKFHIIKSNKINAPLIKELPFALECELISYDKETGHTYAKIVNISVDSKVLTKGKIDIKKLKPIILNSENGSYYSIGRKVGNAFKDYKKIINKKSTNF